MDDFFGGRAGVEGGYYGVERYAGATDADHAITIGADRNLLGWNLQLHEPSVGGVRGRVNLSASEPFTGVFGNADFGTCGHEFAHRQLPWSARRAG